MAPKRGDKKRKLVSSPYRASMNLRSRGLPCDIMDQEASSRIRPMDTSPKKKSDVLKRCMFIDDEAQVDENSNYIEEDTMNTDINEDLQDDINEDDGDEEHNDINEDDGDEDEQKHSRLMGKQISLGLMKDVLSQFFVKKRTFPPLVPLCRLVVHEAVRFARDDNEWLISTFDSAAYLETMGHFLVSLTDSRGDTLHVTAADLEAWGPLWRECNDEFERKLGKEWQELKGKKFLVWDGNHRLKTWSKRIREKYSDNAQYHVSVRCQFLEVTKTTEAELLLALDTSNVISRAHVTPNIAHEVYMFQKFGMANKASIIDRLTPEMREWAKVEMTVEARYYHGVAPWYNTPCGIISQLVWKDEFCAFMSKETAKLHALGLNDVEKKKRLDKATKVEEERLKDRGYKFLSIANPLNGDEFFKVLFGIKWDDAGMLKITRDKLYCLTSSKIPPERKKIILHLMSLTKAKDPQYPHFGDYKIFRGYMKKETYWAHLNDEATLLIERLQVEGPQLPKSFPEFYKINMKDHILQAFAPLMDAVKSSDTSDKMPELVFSTKRVIYRWIMQCMEEQVMNTPLLFTREWSNVRDENTMYSPSLLERKLTSWEANVCPWWLDYPMGVIPKQEIELHERFKMESEEYIAEVQEESVPHTSHEPTLLTIGSGSHATPLASSAPNKGKGLMEPPSTSTIPTTSSGSLLVATPMTPASMRTTTSTSMHTTSFVAESSLGREVWERRPATRSVGVQYQTVVDVLLVDVSKIDKFALASINKFFATQKTNLYSKDGVPCREVARLIFADFPTNLLVDGLDPTPFENMSVPKWNTFYRGLVVGCMDLACEFLADQGFLVTTCVAEHIGDFIAEASRVGLMLLRTWTVMCNQKAYRHPLTREAVLDLTMCLWFRIGHPVPRYDREAGEKIAERLFPADCSYIMDDSVVPIQIDGIVVRAGAERSSLFFRWILATFTDPYDYVLDVFAGCGGLGRACAEDRRHCMCLELDDVLFEKCLSQMACGPVTC